MKIEEYIEKGRISLFVRDGHNTVGPIVLEDGQDPALCIGDDVEPVSFHGRLCIAGFRISFWEMTQDLLVWDEDGSLVFSYEKDDDGKWSKTK
jgi:hypothetical protein